MAKPVQMNDSPVDAAMAYSILRNKLDLSETETLLALKQAFDYGKYEYNHVEVICNDPNRDHPRYTIFDKEV